MAAVLKQLEPEPAQPRYERYVWHSRFGDIVIEVKGDFVYVDGKRVEAPSGLRSGPDEATAARAQDAP